MFITVKNGEGKILVNVNQIKFIVQDTIKDKEIGSIIVFDYKCCTQTDSTISEIEQMIAEDTE